MSSKFYYYKVFTFRWPKLTRTSIISNNQSSNSTDNIIINDTTNLHYEEVSLDKNSLNKICVKDINLMIELIESEISFVKKREHIDLKPIKMAKYKLSTINKVFNNKAKSPKLK